MKITATTLLSLFMFLFASALSYSQQSASAHWPLTNPDEGGTELSSILSGQVQAPDQHLNNMESNQYSGPNNSQRVISIVKAELSQRQQLNRNRITDLFS